MTYEAALTSLADPRRREIFERIAATPSTVAALARAMPISQPAVSQHLKVLKEAGLVRSAPSGASNVYSIDPAGLGPLRVWLDRFWDQQLAAFVRAANEESEKNG